MLQLLFFVLTIYIYAEANVQISNVQVSCANGYDFQYAICYPRQNGISYAPQPQFDFNACPKACIRTYNKCVPDIIPSRTSFNCAGVIDEKCTEQGKKCPYGCKLQSNKCVPKNNDGTICAPVNDHKCPTDCNYNINTNKCTPQNNNAICEFINNTLQCPNGCTYNFNVRRCVSGNPNVVCQMEYGLKCPELCSLNPYGDNCISAENNIDQICEMRNIPLCSFGCNFSTTYNRCIPSANDNICEPITQLKCSSYYVINESYPICSKFNQNSICKIDNSTVQFPTRLNSVYGNIKCIMNYTIDCTYPAIVSCTPLCVPNLVKNKCDSLSKNTICWSTYLSCPTNYDYVYNYGCLRKGSDPICPPDNLMFNASGQILCGPKWFYG